MRKILVFTILLSALLLMSGCQQGVTGTPEAYYKFTGDKAIDAKFLEGSPASSEIDTYQKRENVDVVVELINRMTEDVPAGKVKVRLTGDAAVKTFFEGATEEQNSALYAIDTETGIATPEEVDLGPIRYVGDLTTKVSKKISGQYCYSLPVKVGDNGKGELRFKVTIQNVGSGTVISSLTDCFKFRDTTAREDLKFEANGAYPIDCGTDPARLSRTDRSRTIDCKVTGIDTTNLGPDASELTLTMSDFAYEDDLQPVNIWL